MLLQLAFEGISSDSKIKKETYHGSRFSRLSWISLWWQIQNSQLMAEWAKSSLKSWEHAWNFKMIINRIMSKISRMLERKKKRKKKQKLSTLWLKSPFLLVFGPLWRTRGPGLPSRAQHCSAHRVGRGGFIMLWHLCPSLPLSNNLV